ncbi:MAG: AcrR family transcriptional regulator [Gammaproteobacteria bacterium]|jgi:AcrR family transcriptional regulator
MAILTGTTSKQSADRKSPGRPRRFDSGQILDSALDLFWKQGYTQTTTRHLETSLSLNQSSIYYTFGSKEKLFDLVLNRYESLTAEALLDPLESSDLGIMALEQFFNNLYIWITLDGRRGCLLINLMAEDGGNNTSFTMRTETYRQRVREGLKIALDRAVAFRELSEGDSESRSMILLTLALGINIAARGGASKKELQGLVKAVISQIHEWNASQP